MIITIFSTSKVVRRDREDVKNLLNPTFGYTNYNTGDLKKMGLTTLWILKEKIVKLRY